MLRRIIAAGSAAAGLVVAGALVPADAATTTPAPVKVLSVSATSVTLKPHHTVTVKATARLNRALVGDEEADVIVGPHEATGPDELGIDELTPTSVPTTLTPTFKVPDSVRTGLWDVKAAVFAGADAEDPSAYLDDTFHVKLPTALKVDAGPEPAAVGETLTVTGTLTRYGQSAGKYASYSGRKVDVYFDPAGSAPRTKVGTATTDASGRFTKKVTAKTTGVWSAEYAGSTYYAGVRSAGDAVTVAKQKTRVSVDASPEPVKKGAKVTVAGRLTHATSVRGTLRYTSYAHKTLTVWFDPAGAKGPTKVATVTTSSSGAYSVKRTQSVAGTWSARFAGTPSYAASAGKDTVAVR